MAQVTLGLAAHQAALVLLPSGSSRPLYRPPSMARVARLTSAAGPHLSRQCHQVTLQTSGLFSLPKMNIDLVQIDANAQQHAARIDRRQVLIPNAVIAMHQVLHAIGFAQELTAVKRVDVDL